MQEKFNESQLLIQKHFLPKNLIKRIKKEKGSIPQIFVDKIEDTMTEHTCMHEYSHPKR